MTCLEFRRRCATEPAAPDAEWLEHATSCPACAEEARRAARLDGLLGAALAIPVPEGLPARVLVRHRMRRPRSRGWALAAAALLAATTAFWAMTSPPSLGEAVAAHARAEWDHGLGVPPVEPGVVDATVGAIGARIAPSGDPVVYAGRCGLGHGTVAHLVLSTPYGPVTLLVMPEEPLAARRALASEGLDVVLFPVDGGSVAVAAQSAEAVTRVESFARVGIRIGPA